MIHPTKEFPAQYLEKENSIHTKSAALPFQLLKCGYCNERSFVLGETNNFNEYLILFNISGMVSYSKNRNMSYLGANNVIISNCNTKLAFYRQSPVWEYFYIVFSGTHAKLYYNMIRDKNGIIPINPLINITSYFTELCQLTYDGDSYCNVHSCFLIHEILHALYLTSMDIMSAKMITPVQRTVVNTAIKYIHEHYKEDLSLEKICSKVSFSQNYFCKLFKKHVGMNLHEYISEYRVNKSKELLSYSKLSIHAIALEVGFNNTLTYSRSFERYNHMTPSEYRRNF